MALAGGQYKYAVMQNAAAGTGNGTAIDCIDESAGAFSTLLFQVTGTFTGTVTFEGTIDGANWAVLEVKSLGVSATVASTATAAGIHRADVRGLMQVRARVSAYTSGAITVHGVATVD